MPERPPAPNPPPPKWPSERKTTRRERLKFVVGVLLLLACVVLEITMLERYGEAWLRWNAVGVALAVICLTVKWVLEGERGGDR